VSLIERSFYMEEAPEAAQARFIKEIGPPLRESGFGLRVEEPGHLAFRARYIGGVLLLGIVTLADWLPASAEDRYGEWDQVEGEATQDMDRVTRRALKKAGRLPPKR
jgi:hypothetical protein